MAQALTVGVDFGGTNIKVGLVDAGGRVAASAVLPTAECQTPRRFVARVAACIETLAANQGARRGRVRGVGIGAPGLIDVRRGLVHQLVNVPGGWRNVPLAARLSARLRCPCVIDNDVNVIALGEWRFGAGRNTAQSVYVTLGTGVGGGLVINGQLVRGVSGSAGEIGHTVLDLNGPSCGCGARGCLEAFIGTAGTLAMARAALDRGASPVLAKLAGSARRVSPAMISDAAQAGDRGARELWARFGTLLGAGLAGVVNLLNPERIVIGGGIANAWRWFAPAMMRACRARAFEVPGKAAEIVKAQLGLRAGIVGAAVLVWEQRGRGSSGR